jgi:hypothetical protein
MAEALARRYALERGFAIETRSGGVMGLEGRPADGNAIAVLQEIGVDLGLHKSAGIDEEDPRLGRLDPRDGARITPGGFASSPRPRRTAH